MIITDVKTVLLTGPCTNDPYLSMARKRRSAAFIEVYTDEGLVGLGETYIGYFFPEAVAEIVDFFKPILVGQKVERIETLWDRMYMCGNFWCRVGLGLSVINGIEAALWDARGKQLGVPVYELLGGLKHEKLLGYATGGPSNYPKDQMQGKLEYYLSLGFKGFKVGAGAYTEDSGFHMPSGANAIAEFEADKLAFMRSIVPKDTAIMMDGHMGNSSHRTWDLKIAQTVMKALEPYDLLFFEEPLPYTDPWGYRELAAGTSVAIAGGECLTGSYEWRVFAEQDCFDIAQPDASFIGGLGTFMKIAAMMESRGKRIATHAWGAGASLMQNVHCGFACANTLILEVPPAFGPLHSEIVGDSFRMKDGNVLPPDTPGLGVVLSDAMKEKYAFVPGSGEFNSVPGKILVD